MFNINVNQKVKPFDLRVDGHRKVKYICKSRMIYEALGIECYQDCTTLQQVHHSKITLNRGVDSRGIF